MIKESQSKIKHKGTKLINNTIQGIVYLEVSPSEFNEGFF